MILQRFCSATAPAALGIVVAALIAGNTYAQAPGLTAKPLLRAALSNDETKESVMVSVEFAPGSTTGPHTHPGDEYAVVLAGTIEVSAEGRETKRVSAGDIYYNPRGIVHEGRNVGDTPARVVITFVVDKGKPITQPVAK